VHRKGFKSCEQIVPALAWSAHEKADNLISFIFCSRMKSFPLLRRERALAGKRARRRLSTIPASLSALALITSKERFTKGGRGGEREKVILGLPKRIAFVKGN
jgi:hypothetical protein